ncbi:MAG: 50S ribosomal protein L11 methyltransferase [Desulfobacterales bacterium]|jgi:protein arginine N-methyltransferase 1
MFPLPAHLRMLDDNIRVEAYRKAIFQTVGKDDVVADIGTGTGILAFFALQAGARKVYAIEKDPIIEVAKKAAQENGFDRICFIQNDSRQTQLPEQVDIIVTETVGGFGIDEGITEILHDAQNRFLKDDGKIIPRALSVKAVPVFFNAQHPFGFLEKPFHGIQNTYLRELAVNNTYGLDSVSSDHLQLLATPGKIFETEFYSCKPVSFPVRMETRFTITQKSDCHGVCVFPEVNVSEGCDISLLNDKRFLTSNWGVVFFPVARKLRLSTKDTLSFYLTLTEKNGCIWRHMLRRENKNEDYTQLSVFGWPSLKHLIKR